MVCPAMIAAAIASHEYFFFCCAAVLELPHDGIDSKPDRTRNENNTNPTANAQSTRVVYCSIDFGTASPRYISAQ